MSGFSGLLSDTDDTPHRFAHPHLGPRLVLLWTVLSGLVALGVTLTTRPHMLNANYAVYHHAADAVLAGGDMYAVAPPDHPSFTYLYPPGTILAYLPFTVVDPSTGFVFHTVISIGFGLALAWVSGRLIRMAGKSLSWIDHVLIVGACLLSPYVVPSLVFGNVNLILAGGIALGVWSVLTDDETRGGMVLGLVSSVKVFPALVGIWLVRLRSYRAVVGACLAGGLVLATGFIAFGLETSQYYVTEVLFDETQQFRDISDPARAYVSLQRPVSLVADLSGPALIGLCAAIMSPAIALAFRTIDDHTSQLVALFVTLVGMVVILPSTFTYIPFVYAALVPLLYLLEGVPRRVFLIGAVVTNISVTLRHDGFITGALPAELATVFTQGLEAVLTVGTFPLFGLFICVAACGLSALSSDR